MKAKIELIDICSCSSLELFLEIKELDSLYTFCKHIGRKSNEKKKILIC